MPNSVNVLATIGNNLSTFGMSDRVLRNSFRVLGIIVRHLANSFRVLRNNKRALRNLLRVSGNYKRVLEKYVRGFGNKQRVLGNSDRDSDFWQPVIKKLQNSVKSSTHFGVVYILVLGSIINVQSFQDCEK